MEAERWGKRDVGGAEKRKDGGNKMPHIKSKRKHTVFFLWGFGWASF